VPLQQIGLFLLGACSPEPTPEPPGGDYPTLPELEAQRGELAGADLVDLVDLSQETASGRTEEGRAVWALRIGPEPHPDVPAQLVVAGMHPRELVPPVVALALARALADPGDPITSTWATWIVVMANPDGYVHVLDQDPLWRKNRAVFEEGVGVDLNRNFPFGWDSDCGGDTDVDSRKYRGPDPASEPEVQALMGLIEAERPARVVDLHSFGRKTKYGYSCWTHPLDDHLATLAARLSEDLGFDGVVERPSAEGELFEWAYATSGGESLLVELMDEFQPPWEAVEAELEDLVGGLLVGLSEPLPVSGFTWDVQTGLPLSATLEVVGLEPDHGEQMVSGGEHGRFDLTLPDGEWELVASADGYESASTWITVEAGRGMPVELGLEPGP